jgi:3-dehydroquinate synthase
MKPELIVLIGFSATGKSSVGHLVAESLGWDFLDTDERIVSRAGKTIAQIFSSDGEEAFRKLENHVITEACTKNRMVVSTGGGAFLDQKNRDLMLSNAVVICLDATPESIYDRLSKSTTDGSETEVRPLLLSNNPLQRIQTLKSSREASYAYAHWRIHTETMTRDQVTDQVLHAWRVLKGDVRSATSLEELDIPATIVRTSSGVYPVYVGWGFKANLTEYLKQVGIHGPLYVVTDQSVFDLQGQSLQEALQGRGMEVHFFTVPAGESSKSLEIVRNLYEWLVEHRAERNHTILAVGGGVVGDLAGFVAATFLRGMNLVQMPTSLAAMVDASIGGKVAVNLPQGKNLVGAFYQPRLVIADLHMLSTLPDRERVAGWAETIKHGMILDEQLIEDIELHVDDLLSLEPETTARVIRRSVAIKSGIVTEDERESTGQRAILNYGHTVAHALEAATEYGEYLHGEAVAIGMTAAAVIGMTLGITPESLVNRQSKLLERFGLPVRCKEIDLKSVFTAMELDKKTTDGDINWVLLSEIAQPIRRSKVPQTLVKQVLQDLLY